MLRIEMLPARNGDALWIEYGDPESPRRIIVDGGTEGSYDDGLRARIETLEPEERSFELLVVTHIDSDHIAGALALLRDETLGATFGDVWFNAWRHLPETLEGLGPVEGELLTQTILHRGLAWNEAFDGKAVVRPTAGKLPHVQLADGLGVTVLGPAPEQLAELRPVWEEVVVAEGLDPGTPVPEPPEEPPPGLEHLGATPDVDTLAASVFKQDTAEANGSSIVLLLEHEGSSALLTGDAFPSVVLEGVNRLLAERDDGPRLAVDAFKVPHHGSRANLSPALVRALDCDRHLFSSNGTNTKHPHPEAVARTISGTGPGSTLFFNYSTRFTEPWADDELEARHDYDAVYPGEGETGLTLELGED
jgi:glyoxylase-like metal-dependent hydrolase (beta-lactamase superfamily II)